VLTEDMIERIDDNEHVKESAEQTHSAHEGKNMTISVS
jgi:hypothetical protein